MTAATTCDIPSINLQPFFEDKGVVIGQDPTPDQRQVAATIHQACQEHGFVHVTNFGLTKEMGDRLFAASKDLFDNPNKSNDYQPWSPVSNTGFSPYRNESLNANRPPDLKEAFNLRFPPAWTNHLDKTPERFRQVVEKVDGDSTTTIFTLLQTIAHRYGLACAVALGVKPDSFVKTLQKYDMCTLRFLHYPPCEFDSTDGASTTTQLPVRAGEHTDYGAYTFLFLGAQGPLGLQVKSVEGGAVGGSAGQEIDDSVAWKDVVVPDLNSNNKNGAAFGAVINTGAMMARWTNDHWKATAHRVIVPDAAAAQKDRYSIAFFVDPDHDQLIEVDDKYKHHHDGAPNYEPISSRDFISMKLQELADGGKDSIGKTA